MQKQRKDDGKIKVRPFYTLDMTNVSLELDFLESGSDNHVEHNSVLKQLSLSLCSTVEVLIAFYENRLKDHYVITPPVLQGLRALVSVRQVCASSQTLTPTSQMLCI